jgi:hypothetical protein
VAPAGLTVDVSASYDGIGPGEFETVSGKVSLSAPLN